MAELFARVAAWAARRARWVLAVALLVAAGAAVGATRIPTDAGVGTLVDSDDPTYEATSTSSEIFGEEPVVVLAKGELQRLILTDNIFRLLRLEGCLSGKVPKGAKPLPGACKELAEIGAVEFVGGPATFLNEAVVQIESQLRRPRRTSRRSSCRNSSSRWRPDTGSPRCPRSTTNSSFPPSSSTCARARGTPKARLAYLFPNNHTAQIIVRLKPDLSESERHRAIGTDRRRSPKRRRARQCAMRRQGEALLRARKGNYVVSGAPVVVDGLTQALKDALLMLFGVALGGDGAHPAARLPLAIAAAAAPRRGRSDGDYLRPSSASPTAR